MTLFLNHHSSCLYRVFENSIFYSLKIDRITLLSEQNALFSKQFDVDGVCLARFYKKDIKQDYSLISSTELSNSMIEEILTIMAWSFSDEIKTYYIIYSNKVKKIDNQFPEINVPITGQVKRKVSYEES